MGKKTLFIILFPLFIFLLSFEMVGYSLPVYESAWENPEFARPITSNLLNYFSYQSPMPSEFNQEEKQHLADVREIFFFAHLLFLILFISLISILFSLNKKEFLNGLQKSGLYTIFISIIILILPFDLVFNYFHVLFFKSGTWIFPSNSLLIKLYPFNFFYSFAFKLFSLAIFFSFLFIGMKPLYNRVVK